MNNVDVARICHEANRAYCSTLGDHSQPPWDDAPQWQRDSALHGVEHHAGMIAKGEEADPSWSHQCWLDEKIGAGWIYGPVKDPVKKEHPCCVPYDALPLDQQRKDFIFAAIVKACLSSELAPA